MLTVGVTGRSGCGKSTVTAHYAALGLPVADADAISRQILQPGAACLPQLAQRFGADILSPTGVLDRRLLADRAFATPAGTAALNAITHPAILQQLSAQQAAAQAAGAPLFVVDAAVLVGTPFAARCQRLVVVTAPFAASVSRICARDGISPEMAARRLNAQTPEAELLAHAHYHIRNDSTLAALLLQADQVLAQLRKECHES